MERSAVKYPRMRGHSVGRSHAQGVFTPEHGEPC
jgi:hypothetical protein